MVLGLDFHMGKKIHALHHTHLLTPRNHGGENDFLCKAQKAE